MKIDIYFSDHFGIDSNLLEQYGALDISLINDLPMFIDPFLLYESDKTDYNKLHEEIIKYVVYLRDLVNKGYPGRVIMERLFFFPEIKQNWLGFSKTGNSGTGLGIDFASSLVKSLRGSLKDFGKETISDSTHIEKLALIEDGVGKDHISDFVANLIKTYLLEYTSQFAREHLPDKSCGNFRILKAYFDYDTGHWRPKLFRLPKIRDSKGKIDYVLLTPKDILTKESTWINRTDMLERFIDIADSASNINVRGALSDLLIEALKSKRAINREDLKDIGARLAEMHPEILDEYIALKEKDGSQATSISDDRVRQIESQFIVKIREFVDILKTTEFYSTPTLPNKTGSPSFDDAMARVQFLKSVIEDKDGYRIFFKDGSKNVREDDIQIMFRLTWLGSPFDINREANNGRGPADFVISKGSDDKTIVEFKLGSSSSIKKNLANQTKIYRKAADAKYSIFVILCLEKSEISSAREIVSSMKPDDAEAVVIIDATPDKPSASKAKDS